MENLTDKTEGTYRMPVVHAPHLFDFTFKKNKNFCNLALKISKALKNNY